MNRILAGILGLAVLVQVIKLPFAADSSNATDEIVLTDIQAGRIGNVVAQILERHHFRQTRFDDTISQSFLTNYLNALDYNHMIFLQSDVDDFQAKYGPRLDDALKSGQVSPAYRIFDVYLERLAERNILVQKLLKQEFDFTKDEEFIAVRNEEPWPKDDLEAAALWRQRIKYELLQGRLNGEKPEETIGVISRRYARLEKTMADFGKEEILQMFLTALSHSYDPHSDYMSPSEAKNFDIQHISLSLTGIGAQLIWEDGNTKIKDLIPGGPAALSKQLRPNDKIIAVAQGTEEPVDVVEMRLNKVVEMIRGKKGSEVRLTIVPAKSPDVKKVVTLIRDEIKFTEQMAQARLYEFQNDAGLVERVGVINLPQFYDNCTRDVETLIQRLKKENVQSLVLDLRRNGGGILDEAVQLTGLFIRKGPVVQVKEPRRDAHVLEDRDSDVAWSGPLVVAVGKLSASASEIVAGALQDYGRAVIVGDQTTHGKGTVQQVLSLDTVLQKNVVEHPGKLKLTVSKFYRVAGSTTQKQGVTPDIILPSLYDYLDIGEGSLDNALPADQTTPAKYTPLEEVKPYLAQLRAASKERIEQSKEFAYVFEDIERLKERKEDKSISLNEQKRIDEKEEEKTRLEARKKERDAREKATSHIFVLDLKSAQEGKPLKPFAELQKEKEAEQAQVSPDSPETAEEALLAADDEDPSSAVDPHLDETIQILRDYSAMLKTGEKPALVKKD